MDSKQFYTEVKKMRRFQKEYFKSRTSASLSLAKKQERLIDEEIERVERTLKEKEQQPTLF